MSERRVGRLCRALIGALIFCACGDGTPGAVLTDAGGDSDRGSPADVVTQDTLACEHPCLDEFGKNAKKLCPDPKNDWKCIEGCCVPVFKCQTDDDCLAQGFEEGQCVDPRFDCRCDGATGVCHPWVCGSDGDCGAGEGCFAGACVDLPDGGDFSVRILSRPPVLQPGATSPLFAEAVSPDQDDLVVSAPITWTSAHPEIVSVDAAGVLTGEGVGGETTITAQLAGGAEGTIVATNLVAASTATLTALVREENTSSPLHGHYLVLSEAGEALAKGAIPPDGLITVEAPFEAADLHIFGTDSDWVSWLALAPGTVLYLPTQRTSWGAVDMDMAAEIVPESSELVGASVLTGTPDFSLYPSLGSIELTLTGFDFDANLLTFDLPQIIGANVERFFHPDNVIPGLNDSEVAELPGGLTFSLEGPAIPEYLLTAPAGTHRVWTLGGRLDINQLAQYADDIFDAVTGGSVEFTTLLGALFPLFDAFWSAVRPPAVMAGDESLTPEIYDPILEMPLALETRLDIPALPALPGGGWPEMAFLMVGAETPDGRLTPLGLSTGADTLDDEAEAPDGIIDADPDTPEPDGFSLHASPTHSGVAGPHTAYTAAILAVNVGLSDDDDRPEAGSAIFLHGTPGAGLPAAPEVGDFLPFPAEASWDEATRTLTLSDVEGGDLQRILIRADRGHRWTVWLHGLHTTTLPVPSAYLEDIAEDHALGADVLLASTVDLVDGCSEDSLLAPGAPTLDLLLGVTARTSFLQLQ